MGAQLLVLRALTKPGFSFQPRTFFQPLFMESLNPDRPAPTGILVPIGGTEDKGEGLDPERRSHRRQPFFRTGILHTLVGLLPAEPRIEIITAACSEPHNAFEDYAAAFRALGILEIGHLSACNRTEADESSFLERAEAAHLVLMAGGDQLRLSATLSGTRLLAVLRHRYTADGLVLAGTSAGAMVMGPTMIAEGSAKEANRKGALMMAPGFCLLADAVVDTHFNQRGRFNRIAQAVTAAPGVVGIGLDEDTGILVRGGRHIEAIGAGSVTIIDGRGIGYNNIGNISADTPLSVEGLRVHILARDHCFDLLERRVVARGAEAVVHGLPNA